MDDPTNNIYVSVTQERGADLYQKWTPLSQRKQKGRSAIRKMAKFQRPEIEMTPWSFTGQEPITWIPLHTQVGEITWSECLGMWRRSRIRRASRHLESTEYRPEAAPVLFPSGFRTWHLLYLEWSKSPELLNFDDFLNYPEWLGKIYTHVKHLINITE